MVNSVDWSVDEKFTKQQDHVAPLRTSSDADEGARACIGKGEPAWSGS